MDKRRLVLVLALMLVFPAQAPQESPHGRLVVVIVLDGFNPIYAENASLNALASLSVPLEVAYPSVTVVSHMILVTAMYPNETNIVNTYAYDPEKLRSNRMSPADAELSRSDILARYKIDTLYGVFGGLTALITAKPKLAEMLGSNGSATVYIEYPGQLDYASVENMLYVNERLMNQTKSVVSDRIDDVLSGERAYVFVNLPGTDYIGHNYGPYSEEYATVAEQEIELVYEFVSRLKTTSVRPRSLVIALGDHSMAEVSANVAQEDAVTHGLVFSDLASAGLPNYAIGTSGNGVLVYLYNNDTATIEQAVEVLRASGKVDGIRTRVPVSGANGTLEDIGLNTPYAGDLFVSLRPPYYFASGTLRGAHGGYSTKVTRSRVFSGRDVVRPAGRLTIFDVAAMAFGFLGIELGHARPEAVLEPKALTSVVVSVPPFVVADSEFSITVAYKIPEGLSGQVSVEIVSDGRTVAEKTVDVRGSGTVKVFFSGLSSGSYEVIVKLLVGGEEVAGYEASVTAQAVVSHVKQPVAKMIAALALFALAVAASLYLVKRIKRFFAVTHDRASRRIDPIRDDARGVPPLSFRP